MPIYLQNVFLCSCVDYAYRLSASLLTLFLLTSFTAQKSSTLLLLQQGKVKEAITLYREQGEDYELLQHMGLFLLQKGSSSSNVEEQLMALFGAGVAAHDLATPILIKGLTNSSLAVRMLCLNLLAERQTDRTDELICRAITSQEPLIRLQGCYLLAKRRDPRAVGQVEALMVKLPPETWSLFAEIFALIGDRRATLQLRKLVNSPESSARLAAIHAIAKYRRDDLLPQIRLLSSHLDPAQQEACAAAIGALKDQDSIERLKKIARSKVTETRLAASLALYRLGCPEYAEPICQMAREENLFAIYALGEIEESQDLLAQIAEQGSLDAKLNAYLSLVKWRDRRAMQGADLLLQQSLSEVISYGGTLRAYRATEEQNTLQESFLRQAVELPESDFLQIAERVLQNHASLVPTAVELLENIGSDQAILLLQKYQQKVGDPFVRSYCNLALFRLDSQGPWSENLLRWVREQSLCDMIRFCPTKQPIPEPNSQLFISSIEALASRQDDRGVQILLDLIAEGNEKNRYTLAGLLIRAIQ